MVEIFFLAGLFFFFIWIFYNVIKTEIILKEMAEIDKKLNKDKDD